MAFSWMRRVVPRFARGAPSSAFLGDGSDISFPQVTGWENYRCFRATSPAFDDYSRMETTRIQPGKGRFATDVRSTRTSPLINLHLGVAE